MNGLRLIGDIGGTNARFAISEHGKYRQLSHLAVDHYPSLREALVAYLATLPEEQRTGLSAALAIAGPVHGDKISMTNRAWSFSIEDLRQSLGFTSLVIVNDFAANHSGQRTTADSHRADIQRRQERLMSADLGVSDCDSAALDYTDIC